MTIDRRRRFMLVDPCLQGPGSHPYHYAVEVLAAAARAGCECRVVAHRNFADGTLAGVWPVRSAFSNTAYSKYTVAGQLDRLDPRGRAGWLPRPPWEARHAARRREERIAAFARELAPALADLRPGDAVLLATASELEIAGLARAAAAVRPAADVGWHALVHFPCYRGFTADLDRQDRRLAWARSLLGAAVAALPGLRLHATTEEIAAQHARLAGIPVGVLPYPVQCVEPVRRGVGGGANGSLRVSCLGDARPEKGTLAVPGIVAAAQADPRLAGLRFTVQTNLGFDDRSRAREHMAIRRGLDALRRRAAAGEPIDLLPGPLDAAAYADALAATDIMLLPYDQERYRARCSGIVLESLATGAVPIVTGGGWMARQLAEPLRRHAAAVTARASVLNERRIDRPRLGAGRPLTIELPVASGRGPVPAGREVIAVEIEWRPGTSFVEPPVRVAIDGAGAPPATVLAADGTGLATTALFPVADAGADSRRVACLQPAAGSSAVASLVVRRLDVAGPVPAGAVGAVIAAPGDAVAALRELVRHFSHYRETAIRQAAAVRQAASGDAVLRRLLP